MPGDSERGEKTDSKARVFLSYSRKDMAFADRLEGALKERGFEPLIDRTDIYAFEDWWKRIEALISGADTIVFVLSPDAVASDVALKEVAHAGSLNKRFAPIVYRRVEDSAVPEALKRLNFVLFDDPARFEISADQLAEALQTDIAWIRKHTEYGEVARRWTEAGRSGGLLLRSPALEEAERWIASRPRSAPSPTEETQIFVTASRRGATWRRNVLTGSIVVGIVIALLLASFAYLQRGKAIKNEELAKGQRDLALVSESTALANAANLVEQRGDAVTGALLALEALPSADTPRPYINKLETALYRMLYLMRERSSVAGGYPLLTPDGTGIVTILGNDIIVTDMNTGQLRSKRPIGSVLIANGARAVTTSAQRQIEVWDLTTQMKLATWDLSDEVAAYNSAANRIIAERRGSGRFTLIDIATGQTVADLGKYQADPDWGKTGATFSPDGSLVLVKGERGVLWNARTGRRIAELTNYKYPTGAVFGQNNKLLATVSGFEPKTVEIWDTKTGKVIRSLNTGAVTGIAFGARGEQLVSCIDGNICQVRSMPDGRLIATLRHEFNPHNPTFTGDGKWLVTGSGPLTLWDATTWEQAAFFSVDGTDIALNSISTDGAFLLTHTANKNGPSSSQIWDLRFQGHAQITTTLKHPDGGPLLEEPRGLYFSSEMTVDQSLAFRSTSKNCNCLVGGDHRWDANSGVYLGAVSQVDPSHTADSSYGRGVTINGVFDYGLIELEYRKDQSEHLIIDTNSAELPDDLKQGQRTIDLGVFAGANVLRVFADTERHLLLAETQMNKVPGLLIGDWDTGRFVRKIDLPYSPVGWRLGPGKGRLTVFYYSGILGVLDFESGNEIVRLKAKSVFIGSGVSLMNFAPDLSKFVVYDNGMTRVYKIFPDYESLVAAARAVVPRCLTPERRKAYGLAPEPPNWCIEQSKWPFDTPDWKAWLAERARDSKALMPQKAIQETVVGVAH